MANGHGGMRTPNNPAPVSGPGALSRRTDGQAARYASGMPYGDGQDFYDMQTSAPMAQTDNVAAGARQAARQAPAEPVQVTPLFAATQRPGEPVTSGAAMGPGPGPARTSMAPLTSETLAQMAQYDPSGELGYLAGLMAARGL